MYMMRLHSSTAVPIRRKAAKGDDQDEAIVWVASPESTAIQWRECSVIVERLSPEIEREAKKLVGLRTFSMIN